jgi:prepilin-type N-terminal cleavage/methylation domain-containing protein
MVCFLGSYIFSTTTRKAMGRKTIETDGMWAQRRAFTLVELMVVIAVVGVLIGLAIPALRHSRESAKYQVVLSRLGSHVRTFLIYTADHHDAWPCLRPITAERSSVDVDGVVVPASYFDQHNTWHLFISGGPESSDWRSHAYCIDGDGASSCKFTPYWYSPTFLTSPEYWSLDSRVGLPQWRGTRADEVRYPDSKCLLACYHYRLFVPSTRGELPVFFGFVDGSASLMKNEDTEVGLPGGVGLGDGSLLDVPLPGMTTPSGIRGRDRR